MKNIVITGVSTGIGYGTCKEFIKHGYRVFGSVRKPEDSDRLKNEFGENFKPILFDLTDHKAIYEAANYVKSLLKNDGLSGLINNAGAAIPGPLMFMPVDLFQMHLDIMVTGNYVVTQAFLPLLGAQKNCPFPPGRIINISSVAGKMASPFMSGYVAAKHAMEGFSKVLRMELQLYGIDVIVVGPGIVKSDIWNKIKDEDIDAYSETDYHEYYWNTVKFFRNSIPSEGYEVDEFSVRLRKIFELKRPGTRYAVVKNKFIQWTLPRLLSDRLFTRLSAKIMKMEKVR